MRDRLLEIRKLLAPDGSVWVHCDDSEQHRLRVMMDEVLGESSFVATVVWQKRYSRDNRPGIGQVHDFLHVYSRDPLAVAERGTFGRDGEATCGARPRRAPRVGLEPVRRRYAESKRSKNVR